MFKKITALVCILAMMIVLAPQTLADTYNNQAYKGTYLSAGATDTNYGKLVIHNIDDENISVDFEFVKNGNQQLVYTFSPGTMNGDSGSLRFSVSYANGQFVSNGTMKITLDDWCVKITCDSDQGQHLFDGTMKPEFNLNPYGNGDSGNTTDVPTTDSPIISGDVSVKLNGETVEFENGIEPVIINDHTFVPLRSVFDKMGINVYWDQYKKNDILNAQTITCTKNNIIVQFSRTYNETGNNVWTLTKWVGENTTSQNFKRINITDLQPTIIDNHSYIPLRVVSEAFDADVLWIDAERTVMIDCDTFNEYKYDSDTISAIEDYSQDIASTYITEDFTNIAADATPYFSSQAKFYRYTAEDTWGDVELHVIYGGYIDVFSKTVGTPIDTSTDTVDDDNGNDIISYGNSDEIPGEDNSDATENSTSPEPTQESTDE